MQARFLSETKMAVVSSDIMYDEKIIGLSDLAFRIFLAAIVGRQTAGDGTLILSDFEVRNRLIPGQSPTVPELQAALDELNTSDLLVQYESDHKQYAFLVGWWNHNRSDRAWRGARTALVPERLLALYPSYAETYRKLPLARRQAKNLPKVPKHSGTLPDSPGHSPPSPSPVPSPLPSPNKTCVIFEKLWSVSWHRGSKKAARKAYDARIKAKDATPEELTDAVKHRHSAYQQAKTEARYRKHVSSFLGPDEHWKKWVTGIPPEEQHQAGKAQEPPEPPWQEPAWAKEGSKADESK